MASSIFLNPSLGITSSGGSITALFADGLAGSPSISFLNEPLSGFFRQATNIIGISVGGSLRMAFDSSGSLNQFSLISCALTWGGLGNSADVILSRVAAGQVNVTDASSHGIGFDVVTDAVMKVRTRAQTGYATVDALGYKVSGVAGVASFGPSPVGSITIVGGIVTAIS